MVINSGWAPISRSRCSTAEREARLVKQVLIIFRKMKSRWGYCDRSSHLANVHVRWSSYHIFYELGMDLNQWCISRGFQICIRWTRSTLFWAYCKDLCAFWYFYVDVDISWVTCTCSRANFERIQYDTSFKPHTISTKNIEASLSMRGSRICGQAAQIWSITIEKYTMVKQQK